MASQTTSFRQGLINRRYGRISRAFDGIEQAHYTRMINAVSGQLERLGLDLSKETLLEQEFPLPDDIALVLQRVLPHDDSSLRFEGFGGGVVDDPGSELSRLNSRLVEKYEGREDQPAVKHDDQVWHDYAKLFAQHNLFDLLEPKSLGTASYTYNFSHTYKNEKWHPIEAVSFDYLEKSNILEKANKWIGRSTMFADVEEMGTLYLLLGAPKRRPELYDAYETAAHSLKTKIRIPVEVVREEERDSFIDRFARMIAEHTGTP